jgi:hypothetical protein
VSVTDATVPGSGQLLFTTTRTFSAVDSQGNSAAFIQTFLDKDTTPPTVSCVQSYEKKCAPVGGVSLDSLHLPVSAADSCDPRALAVTASVQWLRATGQPTSVTWTATDASGNASTCVSTVTVDAAPPTQVLEDDVPQFWPPNNKFVTVDLKTCVEHVHDPCNTTLTAEQIVSDSSFNVVQVGADEPNSAGPKDKDDVYKIDHRTVAMRVSRLGTGNGRVYHVGITYQNAEGAQTQYDCRYGVPHDQSGAAAVDDGVSHGWIKAAP